MPRHLRLPGAILLGAMPLASCADTESTDLARSSTGCASEKTCESPSVEPLVDAGQAPGVGALADAGQSPGVEPAASNPPAPTASVEPSSALEPDSAPVPESLADAGPASSAPEVVDVPPDAPDAAVVPAAAMPPGEVSSADGIVDWSAYQDAMGDPQAGGVVFTRVATNLNGDAFVAGFVPEETGTHTVAAANEYSAVDGALLDSVTLPTVGSSRAHGITVAPDGSVYVVGFTEGDLNGESGPGNDAFIMKYAAGESPSWARLVESGEGYDTALGVTVDAAGDVVVVGNAPPSATSNPNGFVAKYTAGGDEVWAQQLGSDAEYTSINAVVANTSSGTLTVAGTTYDGLGDEQFGSSDAFVAQYTKDGELVWLRQFGTEGVDGAEAVALDDEGNAFVGGSTDVDFATADEGGPFLAKVSPSGDFLWTVHRGGNSRDIVTDVVVDDSQNVFVTGRLDEVDAEGSLVDTDALLAKYSPSGELVWEQALGGAEQSTGLGLANDHMGHVILCGWDYDPAVPQDETAARGFLIRFD